MIVGHIKNITQEKKRFAQAIQRGFDYITSHDFTKMEPGRYVIDGEKLYANLDSYKSRPAEDCRPEAHQNYIDIQYIVKGCEIIGYASHSDSMEVAEDCLAERDVIFYKDMFLESGIVMNEGMYAIFYPQDVHRPCCNAEEKSADVLKVVVKVRVDVL